MNSQIALAFSGRPLSPPLVSGAEGFIFMLALAIVNALAGVRHDTASQLQAFAIDSIVRAHRSKAVATVAAQPRSPLSLTRQSLPSLVLGTRLSTRP